MKGNIIFRAVPNIRFVFASGPNSGMNGYSVFGRIVVTGPNTNSDICFCVCGDLSEWRVAIVNSIINIKYALVTSKSFLGIGVSLQSASWDQGTCCRLQPGPPIAWTTVSDLVAAKHPLVHPWTKAWAVVSAGRSLLPRPRYRSVRTQYWSHFFAYTIVTES